MPDVNDWNAKIIDEFRSNGGKVGGSFEGAPMVLLTTIGARSGQERTSPMMYLDDPEHDRVLVFASKAGADTNPDWYHNLKANPTVTVEQGTEKYQATATELEEPERGHYYAKQAAAYPGFQEYQEKTDRVIPVIALKRA